MSSFQGIWVPLVTPFHNSAIDFVGLQRLVSHLLEGGIDGIVVCGTTAEAAALSKHEQLAVLDAVLELVPAQVVLMGLLFLRGPQTLNELLTRSARMHDFEDTDQVQHLLERLIARDLALLLPRQSGQREDRYMHALGDPDDMDAILAARQQPSERGSASGLSVERFEALEARVAALEARLAALE